jgi:hypothetical protein
MRDNSRDYYVELDINPLPRFHFTTSYLYAVHGNEYPYIMDGPYELDEYPYMKDKTWSNEKISFQADYEFSSNAYITVGYTIRDIQGYAADGKSAEHYLNKFTPEFFHGETETFEFGLNIGF